MTGKIATITMLTLLCAAATFAQKNVFFDTRDKKTYKTAKIGVQTWMVENLGFKAKGSICPGENFDVQTECNKTELQAGEQDSVAVCVEYKKPTAKQIQEKNKRVQADCARYGRLYDAEMAKTACPAGWHLPNPNEWDAMRKAIGDVNEIPKIFPAFQGAASWFGEDPLAPIYGSLYLWDSNKDLKFIRCVQGNSLEETIEANEKAAVESAVGKQFNPKIKYGSIIDARDKIAYKTTKIGNQNWMAENLNHNANGSKCYKDKDYYCKRDGRLYDLSTAKTACPAGWHLPSDAEWSALGNAVGGKTAAAKLKADNGTNDFGFSALSTGSRWWNAELPQEGFGHVSQITEELSISLQAENLLYNVRCVEGGAPN